MTALQPIKGTDAGLTGDEQVRIALRAIAERGGVAQMSDIYAEFEAILNPQGYTLSEQGRARACRHEMEAQRIAQRNWTAARKEDARLA